MQLHTAVPQHQQQPQHKAAHRTAPCSRRHTRVSRPQCGSAPSPQVSCCSGNGASIVDGLLRDIEGSDGGANLSSEKREQVDCAIEELEKLGAAQEPRPLLNDLVWGNFNVVYTSTSRSKEKRSPSGGRFRGRVGRALFQTTGLFQSLIKPDIATNKVAFKLFGVLPGAVGLRGRIKPVGAGNNTVRVDFEPPVLQLGELHLRIGRESDVELATTYLDERVRVGKGSRGSLFLFTRGGPADAADMVSVGRQFTTAQTAQLLAAACIAALLGGLALWLTADPLARALAPPLLLSAGLLLTLLRRKVLITENQVSEAAASEAQGRGAFAG